MADDKKKTKDIPFYSKKVKNFGMTMDEIRKSSFRNKQAQKVQSTKQPKQQAPSKLRRLLKTFYGV